MKVNRRTFWIFLHSLDYFSVWHRSQCEPVYQLLPTFKQYIYYETINHELAKMEKGNNNNKVPLVNTLSNEQYLCYVI